MSFTSILIYGIAPLLIGLFFFIRKKFAYFEERGIFHLKPKSWIFGNMSGVGFKRHFVELMNEAYNESRGKDVIAGIYCKLTGAKSIFSLDKYLEIFRNQK